MYGYEAAIGYMPATEGKVGDAIKSWGKQVLAFIQNCGKRIKEFIMNIVNSIKAKRASKEELNKASSEAADIIKDIDDNIENLLDSCINNIEDLASKYESVISSPLFRQYQTEGDDVDTANRRAFGSYKLKRSDLYDGHKGMDKLYKKHNRIDSEDLKRWNDNKIRLAAEFKKNAETAEDIREKLNKLRSMPLTLEALKNGYNVLSSIFSKNSKFADQWRFIVIAHDWSTGEIRGYLGKVVSMYKMGINATNALGKQLSANNVRHDDGKIYKNEYVSGHKKEKAFGIRESRKSLRNSYEKVYGNHDYNNRRPNYRKMDIIDSVGDDDFEDEDDD